MLLIWFKKIIFEFFEIFMRCYLEVEFKDLLFYLCIELSALNEVNLLLYPSPNKCYFLITFCSDLMCNKDIVWVGVEFLAFNVFLHTKSEEKVMGNWFYALIMH